MTRMLWWALWPLALAIVSFCALWFGATGGGLSDALAAFFGARDGQAGVIALIASASIGASSMKDGDRCE